MSATVAVDRRGLAAALFAYGLWGVFPLLFDAMAAAGARPLEIVGWRTIFAVPFAALLVASTPRGRAGLRAALRLRSLLALALSSALIAVNWSVYVFAVTTGGTIAASLGYFINPLISLAAGALFFGEKIPLPGRIGVGLAVLGVAVQALALGQLPWISLVLAFSFAGYGVVRKTAAAEAGPGLLVECLFLLVPAVAVVGALGIRGEGVFGRSPTASLLLLLAGPATVLPLTAFAVAARRLPLSLVGVLQFLSPSLQFACGLALGERLKPMTALAFGLIWAGVAAFAWGSFGRARRRAAAPAGPALQSEA